MPYIRWAPVSIPRKEFSSYLRGDTTITGELLQLPVSIPRKEFSSYLLLALGTFGDKASSAIFHTPQLSTAPLTVRSS